MSRADPDLLRVSVLGTERRSDLALPAGVPVATLLGALHAEVGAAEEVGGQGTAHDLRTVTGRSLDPETGLREQGVRDGDLLVLTAREPERRPHPHDDLVDAVREAVARDRTPLSGAARGAAALLAALTLVLLTLGALVALEGSALDATAGASGLVAAAALLIAARPASARTAAARTPTGARSTTRFDRAAGAPGPAHPPVLLLCGVAASVLATASVWLLTPAAHACLAGGAALATVASAGLALLVAQPGARAVLVPLVLTGAALVATGVASLLGPGAAGRVLPACVVLAVTVAGVAPAWALPVVGRGAEPLLLGTGADAAGVGLASAPGSGTVPGTKPGAVQEPVRAAYELVVAAVAAAGLLLAATAPVAVAGGSSAVALVLAAAALTALRSRRHHGRALVLTGLAAGAGGLVSTAVAILVLAPTARPLVVAVLLLATTVLACAVPVLPRLARRPAATVSASAVRARRLAGAAETAALVSLLPLLAVSSGLLDLARGG